MITNMPERSSWRTLKCIRHRKERLCKENNTPTVGGQELRILHRFIFRTTLSGICYFYHHFIATIKRCSVVKCFGQGWSDIVPVTLCQGVLMWPPGTFLMCPGTYIYMKAHTTWHLKKKVNNEKKTCCAAEFNKKDPGFTHIQDTPLIPSGGEGWELFSHWEEFTLGLSDTGFLAWCPSASLCLVNCPHNH